MTNVKELVIIGSGPAGLTAAIYSARASLEPVVLEGEPSSTGDQPGGQLMLTTEVENYPGFPDGVMGPDLMINFRKQAERFGTEFHTIKATKVDFSSRPFKIWTNNDHSSDPSFLAQSVIVSTGAKALMLNIPNETELVGHGVSTCATCDGFFFKDQKIVVVGGGDSAIEEATFLTKFASEVTIIHRRDELRASKIMQDRAFKNEKISFMWDSEVKTIIGKDKLEAIEVLNNKTSEVSKLNIQGLFVAIGHRPNTDLFVDQLETDQQGYLITQPSTSKTNVEGVFACGDVQDSYYRQAITAAGSGCMAAIDAERWLESTSE